MEGKKKLATIPVDREFISSYKISDNGALFLLCLHAHTFEVVSTQGCSVPHAQSSGGRRVGDIRSSSGYTNVRSVCCCCDVAQENPFTWSSEFGTNGPYLFLA